jgi:hypothetical protein
MISINYSIVNVVTRNRVLYLVGSEMGTRTTGRKTTNNRKSTEHNKFQK